MVFGMDLPDLPLFVTLIIILSFIVWSKMFKKKGEIFPKNNNEVISLILIFLLFLINLIGSLFLISYMFQRYLFMFDIKIITEFIYWSVILIFFISLYFIASIKKERFSEIFYWLNSGFPSAFLGFFVPTRITLSYVTSYQILNILYAIILSMVLFSFTIVANKKISKKILEINKPLNIKRLIDFKKISGISLFLFFISIFVIMNYTAKINGSNIEPSSYEINSYSGTNFEAFMKTDIYFSKWIAPSSKRIVLRFDPSFIGLNDGEQKYFELDIEKNGSIEKILDYSAVKYTSSSDYYSDAFLVGQLLVIEMKPKLINRDFDHFVLRGAKGVNISNSYNIDPLPYWLRYSYDKDLGLININFNITDNLNLNSFDRGFIFIFNSGQLADKFMGNCSFNYQDSYFTLNDKKCIPTDSHEDILGSTCGNWTINLRKEEEQMFYFSQNNGEKGSLIVNVKLMCKR